MKLINTKNNFSIDRVRLASSFVDRGIGLMFARGMGDKNALVIRPCKSIHTLFMRFDLDVIFVDKHGIIKKIIKQMRPWRVTGLVWKSEYVVEMKASDDINNFSVGDRIEIHD